MTAYHGGKQRIGKQIAEMIYDISTGLEEETGLKIKGYCEPFCGMLGVYQHIPELFKDHKPKLIYKAGDINKSVIMMWQEAQKDWKPPTKSSEKEYNELKYSKDSALKGYIGHQYSFGGQYFNGYAPKYGKSPNSNKASQNIVNISKKIKDIKLSTSTYKHFSNLKNFIIYCDPPYNNTLKRYYINRDNIVNFDNNEFWKWCRKMSENNIIFVSSYDAPKDFLNIMNSSHKLTGMCKREDRKRIEKLYVLVSASFDTGT